ncbi:MAG: nucleotidyltransferase [Oscillospiraceae bacterium]|nr:nucleotidyltransferase [Oscillospiraceae bacterium]MDD4414031.1 nucleotidyltransferase [Oscillospiraceae bacterium]
MAAGMGSRFGGLKQITPVGPSGEMIIDYSIYDALSAGFKTIVFVIKREIEQAFKQHIGNRIAKYADVKYVYQELDNLPDGFVVPEGRTKPWGTGHAVLSCRGTVDGSFAVINADDYYGRECYGLMYDFLTTTPSDDRLHFAMAGYILENTLTENGYVSRGVCAVDDYGMLKDIVERVHIELRDGQAMFTEDGGNSWSRLAMDSIVSMNCWAFPAGTLEHFETLFSNFLSGDINPVKSEFYLPFAVDSLLKANKADVKVLKTADRWFGMTYTQDRDIVINAIHSLVQKGVYPERLWKK